MKRSLLIIILFAVCFINRAEISTISSTFNNTPISAGNYIWFRAVFKLNGASSFPVTIGIANQVIISSEFSINPPNTTITFHDTGDCTVSFSGGSIVSVVKQGLGGNYILTGCIYQAVSDISGGLNPVSWTIDVSSSQPGVSVQWKWTAAVYSSFTNDYNLVGIKPCDDSNCGMYLNTDHAGISQNYKAFEIDGAKQGGYSGTRSFNILSPLPVTFTDFSAVIEERSVLLSWTTATEINNDYFTVERSNDSRSFIPVQHIRGAGNSTIEQHYGYKDSDPFINTHTLYYRIRQTDFDGTTSFSPIISVTQDAVDKLSIYPNPSAGEYIYLKGDFQCNENILIRLFDLFGREVFNEYFNCNQSIQNIRIRRAGLSGTYILYAISESENLIRKLQLE